MAADHTRYVIVGGSAAGMAAAQAIREQDAMGTVTVLSAESDQPYFRPMIPYLVTGRKTDADLAMAGKGPYTADGIDVQTESMVEQVDTGRHMVAVQNQPPVSYDRLLLATGSSPYIPPEIEGTDQAGVFALRTLADARGMAARAETTKHAVMLGGGLLNLKAAFALLERGIQVTLVVFSPEVLSQLMEPEDAGLVRRALDRAGLQIRTGCAATAIISGSTGVSGVALDDGSELACQMVCIGKGVRPTIGFLEESGLDLDQGIIVDRMTTCSDPNVFAAGDAAVTFDPVTGDRMLTGLWTNAVEMGRCAGFNMAGRETAYGGTFGIMNATQIADEPFVSMGTVHTGGGDYEVHVRGTASTYRKLVFNAAGDRLVGALFVGNIAGAGMYRYVIRERMDIGAIKGLLIDQKLHYGHFMQF